ncbi:MAG: SEC-C domain-containing protein [Bacillota bacterium]
MRIESVLSPDMKCPCGSGLNYDLCCLEPVTYVTRRIKQTLSDAVPAWDRIELPTDSLGLMAGLRPKVGEDPPTVELLTEAVQIVVDSLLDYSDDIAELDEGLRDLVWESDLRIPADSLSDCLFDGLMDDSCSGDTSGVKSRDLIAHCLKPHLTPGFVDRVFWHLIFRARRSGTGPRTLSVVVWGLWNLHQDLPLEDNAVWDALYRVSMADMWEQAEEDGFRYEVDSDLESVADSSRRLDIIRLRNSSERAVLALVSGRFNFDLPLFSIINGAIRLRSLMANPDYPGYEALFDARAWRPWGEHPITRYMRTPMKRDWQHFLPEFERALEKWLDSQDEVDDDFAASIMATSALLECHGLPELDDLLAVIYTSCVRDTLSQKRPGAGVTAIIEKHYVKLLRYTQDLWELGQFEAARHVRRSLLHGSSD